MEILKKIFGQKLLNSIIMAIIGLLIILYPNQFPSKSIGWVIFIISILFVIHESKLRYYIKIKKTIKKVRSPGEKFIEKYFDMKKIKYLYEKPLKLAGEHKPLKPDFFLPEFDVYVEYWGRWNTDFEYRKECNHKKKLYKENEIKLVELYPDNLYDKNRKLSINQLDWKFTQRLLNVLKKERS